MLRYYTRACNFYYGKKSKSLVKKKSTLPLSGNSEISFDTIEIISRLKKKEISIKKIKYLPKLIKKQVSTDLKKITAKKKNFGSLDFNKIPNIMGILNLTPDSFSDGGMFNQKKKAVNHADQMFKDGADIIDVGGESTRPGSKKIDKDLEWHRINKTLKLISKKLPISLDTRKSLIMDKGIKLGVKIINDVSGLSHDPETINILKNYKIPFVIQHSQGEPENMQNKPSYKNELLDIYDFFKKKSRFFKIYWN